MAATNPGIPSKSIKFFIDNLIQGFLRCPFNKTVFNFRSLCYNSACL